MSRLDRQGFLGPDSEGRLRRATVAVVGLGGGGSHVVQQMAHLGIGGMVLVDPDHVEDTNTNRLVGATLEDVAIKALKTDIAARLVRGLQPECRLKLLPESWEKAIHLLRDCDVIVGAVDSFLVRDQLERFARANLIPYIDVGMDVHEVDGHGYLISGQVILSLPEGPCMHCCGVLTPDRLRREAERYGAAGGRPQVIWPNGVLASTAVGMVVQLLTPWHRENKAVIYLEYDGNLGTLTESQWLKFLKGPCPHHLPEARGDAFFDIREQAARLARGSTPPPPPPPPPMAARQPKARRPLWRRILRFLRLKN